MNKIKNKKVFLFTKQRRFHQVKVTSLFLLNKMMATSITKQPRGTQFTTNYRIAEEGSFHINYKIAEEGSLHINYKIAEEGPIYN